MTDYDRGYNMGFADGNQEAALLAVPVLKAVLEHYGADLPPALRQQIEAALKGLWPFETPGTSN